MANRYQTAARTWIYRFLALRDGERCLKCHRVPKTKPLQIDHADGNCLNNDPENLSLLCERCNNLMRKLSPLLHRKTILTYRATCERERDVICAQSHNTVFSGLALGRHNQTETNKSLLDYNQGGIEMRANALFEVRFREWIIGVIKAQGSYLKSDAIASGAEVVGCATQTIARYLQKLTSENGILAESYNSLRQTVLIFRAGYAALEAEAEAEIRERLLSLKPVAISGNGHGNGHKETV